MSDDVPQTDGPADAPRNGHVEGPAPQQPAENEGWRYALDPGYDQYGPVPAHAVIGAWPVGREGALGQFVSNPGHRPPPTASHDAEPGVVAPSDLVSTAMLGAVTGQGSPTALVDALREATVYLPSGSEGLPTAYRDDSGKTFVVVLTDPGYGPPSAPRLLPIALTDLLDALLSEDTEVRINHGSSLSMDVSSAELRAALADDAPPGDGHQASGNASQWTLTGTRDAATPLPPIPRKGELNNPG
ncbi:type VII secretion system-associated protein [Streptomyces sp. NPDC085937]|uniref:type VII secretion system-associated protein n=1 Tax=Streptomyces sp. NPDC085937 TaxID=3365742 RepID=UPI0037D65E0D